MPKIATYLTFFLLTFAGLPVFAADWEPPVTQFLSRHGFKLPPSRGDGVLRALEIGAGHDPVSRDQFSLDHYGERYPGVNLPNMIDADATRVPLAANSIDVIFAHNVPEQFSSKAFVTEADRLLRPGGVFIVVGYARLHDLESLDYRLVEYTKSTIAVHAMGYDLIQIRPGELRLPNAPQIDGFAFVKPSDKAKAEANIKNPKWQIPKVLQIWQRDGRICAEDLLGL